MNNLYRLLPLIVILFCVGCSSNDDSNPEPEALFWEKVSVGGSHVLAIRSDGTLWAWGTNDYGQVGDGTTINKLTPVQIGTDSDWESVSAGQYFSAALKENGHLFLWGINEFGQIGNGIYEDQLTPLQVGTDSWTKINIMQGSVLALRSDGTLWGWGNNEDDQGGIGSTDWYLTVPAQIGTSNDWADIEMGAFHAFAKNETGELYGWGGSDCSLGGNLANAVTPQLVSNAAALKMPSAFIHSMVLDNNGKLFVAGTNSYGAVGIPPIDQSFCEFEQLGNDAWAMVDTGIMASAGIKTDGSLWVWGFNGYLGQLGFTDGAHRSVPTQLGTAHNWKFVDIGGWYNVALTDDNELWAWGLLPTMGLGADGPVAPYIIPCPQ